MSATSTITIVWINGEDQFCLGKVGLVFDLEEKCGAGIATIFWRIRNDHWKLNDIRETIRLGLIGGGMTPIDAMKVVNRHIDEPAHGLLPLVLVANAILSAVMEGVRDDPVGKKKEDGQVTPETPSSTTTADSVDRKYTRRVKRSAGIQDKRMK